MLKKTVLSREVEKRIVRQGLFLTNKLELQEVALLVKKRYGLSSTDDFAMLCINSEDPAWDSLLKSILSQNDREAINNSGETIVKAAIFAESYQSFLKDFPKLNEVPSEGFPEGIVRTFVFDAGGIYLRGIALDDD